MIKVKHFLDAVEEDDGLRMWVEPIGLVKELAELCQVNHIVPHLGPPKAIWEWFSENPEGYETFRGQYHEFLSVCRFRPALQRLACAGQKENFTLLHGGDDPEHNSASALREFINELEAYCPRDSK